MRAPVQTFFEMNDCRQTQSSSPALASFVRPLIYKSTYASSVSTFCPLMYHTKWKHYRAPYDDVRQKSCITNTKTRRFGIFLDQSETTDKNVLKTENWTIPRIAIVGGGICGVTAAKAIVTRLNTIAPTQKVDIQVYEADPRSVYGESSRSALRNQKHPDSNAATSKNANSLGKKNENVHVCWP